MALNCKLDRNISLSQPTDSGGTDACNSQDISMGVGGISSPVLVYNISDVPSLTYEGDNRSDYSLFIDTINSTGQFYKVDHTDATYNEEYDPQTHKWTHTLTLTVANIQPLFEDILADAVNGKYLVCFKPNGAEDYRMFGWKFGATLDYSVNIQSDSHGYTITFEDSSEYPLMTVDRDNFGAKNKTYTPIFKPLYDVYYCEQDGSGRHTGYIVAMYVVKVNSAGQPLDNENKLCQWSGKKQDAYKIDGIQSDGGYNILGTYQKTATFDGKPVKVYDLEKCPANVNNSIWINSKKAETINLNSTISGGTFTITSSDDWSMVSDPQYVTISPVEGENGNTQCSVHHNGVGGCEQIKFMNNVTREIVTLDVCVNLITVGNDYTYECNTTDITIVPTVEGCSSAYTYSVSPSISNSKDEYGNIHLYPTTGTSGTYTITLVHSCDSNEVKTINVEIVCHSTVPTWQLFSSYCEIDSQGEYTKYRINTFYDTNPYSPNFGNIKTEKKFDATCENSPSNWQLINNYCELDEQGVNTGYYVSQYQDINVDSPTYGQTRTEKVMNITQCPAADVNPEWIPDPDFEGYCEQKYYEPSHTLANSGYWIGREVDENRLSPTYRQKRDTRTLSTDCPAPSTSPDIEEVSYTCELTTTEDDFLVMTGYKISTGLDKNVYSPTYLQVTSARIQDVATCPPNNPKPEPTGCTAFIVDGGSISTDSNGTTGCDSAFLWVEGTPVFTPATASSWVSINYYHWDTDPASKMCSDYAQSPCVANSLMKAAGLVDNDLHCSDIPPHPLSDFPQIVQDAVNKTGKYAHALGTVEYVIAPNTSENSRSCTIHFIVDSEECPSQVYEITQSGVAPTPTCDCSTYDVMGTGTWASSAASSYEYTVARYTGATNCSEPFTFSLASGANFMGDFRASGGYVYAKCIQDNPGGVRQSVYTMSQGSCTGQIYINQEKKYTPPSSDDLYWDMTGQPTNYTATTANNYLDLEPFYSVLGGDYTNCVISANVSWITTNSYLYYNNNEMRSNMRNTLYMEYNTGSSSRVGTLTLTQKGGSRTITCTITQQPSAADCSITSFTLNDSSVCQGDPIHFSLDVADTRCTEDVFLQFRDANSHGIYATVVPSGGHASGSFSTSSAALGQGYCAVNGQRYYCTINDCTAYCNFVITNSTGSEISFNYVMFYNQGSGAYSQINLGQTYTIANNGTKTISNVLISPSYVGNSFSSIIVVNTGQGSAQWATNASSGTLSDGSTYTFSVTHRLLGMFNFDNVEDTEETE